MREDNRVPEVDLAPSPAAIAERQKERVYATLTVMAVTLSLAQSGHHSEPAAALAIAGTALGLWLATIAADQQAHRVVFGTTARGADLRRLLYVSSPLLAAAVGPLLLVGLAALELLPLRTALYTATWLSAAALLVWGFAGGLKMGAGWIASLVVGAVDLAIGVVIVVVKMAAGH